MVGTTQQRIDFLIENFAVQIIEFPELGRFFIIIKIEESEAKDSKRMIGYDITDLLKKMSGTRELDLSLINQEIQNAKDKSIKFSNKYGWLIYAAR